nr:hypothetical protein [Tanacetum cinerariifolium]
MFGYGDKVIYFLEEGIERGFCIDKDLYIEQVKLEDARAGRGVMKTNMVHAGVESEFKYILNAASIYLVLPV